jgi:hypothetical protein
VSAVTLNVTVADPTAAGDITVWPSGTPRQQTSNLNFQAGQNIPNLVIVPVGADGEVQLYNGSGGTVHLVADVAGHILSGQHKNVDSMGFVVLKWNHMFRRFSVDPSFATQD